MWRAACMPERLLVGSSLCGPSTHTYRHGLLASVLGSWDPCCVHAVGVVGEVHFALWDSRQGGTPLLTAHAHTLVCHCTLASLDFRLPPRA